jgi:hypothetical protein
MIDPRLIDIEEDFNPRNFDLPENQESPEDLALEASISEVGLIQPLIVRFNRETGRATLVDGERRLRSIRRLIAKGHPVLSEADDYADTSDAARLLQGMIEGNSQERAESERLRKIGTLEAEIKLSTIPGFFPTPSAVVDLMLEQAHIETGMHVLEPSAGSGNIADAIRRDHPGAFIDVCEVNLRLRELLELKGHRLIASDFLEFKAGTYERILMNPPFELLNDCKHVRHAYDLLADRGVLVSIMSPSFEFRNDRKSTEFREWLGTVKATWETLPDGSFKSSGTGVSTRLLVIDK